MFGALRFKNITSWYEPLKYGRYEVLIDKLNLEFYQSK